MVRTHEGIGLAQLLEALQDVARTNPDNRYVQEAIREATEYTDANDAISIKFNTCVDMLRRKRIELPAHNAHALDILLKPHDDTFLKWIVTLRRTRATDAECTGTGCLYCAAGLHGDTFTTKHASAHRNSIGCLHNLPADQFPDDALPPLISAFLYYCFLPAYECTEPNIDEAVHSSLRAEGLSYRRPLSTLATPEFMVQNINVYCTSPLSNKLATQIFIFLLGSTIRGCKRDRCGWCGDACYHALRTPPRPCHITLLPTHLIHHILQAIPIEPHISRHSEVCKLWNEVYPHSMFFDPRDVLIIWSDNRCETLTLPNTLMETVAGEEVLKKAAVVEKTCAMLICNMLHHTDESLSHVTQSIMLRSYEFITDELFDIDRYYGKKLPNQRMGFTTQCVRRRYMTDSIDETNTVLAMCGLSHDFVVPDDLSGYPTWRLNNPIARSLYGGMFKGPVVMLRLDDKMQLHHWRKQDTMSVDLLCADSQMHSRLWMWPY